MGSLSILFRQCSYPVILRKMLRELQVHHSSFSFLSGGLKFKLSVLIIFLSSLQCFLIPVHLSIIHLSLFSLVPECTRYLRRLTFPFSIRSGYFEVVISFKPFNSTGAIYLFKQSLQRCFFEWALTHRSFPRILPDSSNFPGASKILFNVWRKNELSSVKCLSPRSVKFFSSLVQPFYSSFRSASKIHGGVSCCHSRIFKTKEEFLLNPYPFFQRFMVLTCCHPFIIVFNCENSFHTHPKHFMGSFHFIHSKAIMSEILILNIQLSFPILLVHRSSIL